MRTLLGGEALEYVWVSLRARIARARSGELERGASAVEWVIITLIVSGLVVAVGYLISLAVRGKATQASTCISGANGANSQQNCP
jgi:Flp pilus assembly pilin Flp